MWSISLVRAVSIFRVTDVSHLCCKFGGYVPRDVCRQLGLLRPHTACSAVSVVRLWRSVTAVRIAIPDMSCLVECCWFETDRQACGRACQHYCSDRRHVPATRYYGTVSMFVNSWDRSYRHEDGSTAAVEVACRF